MTTNDKRIMVVVFSLLLTSTALGRKEATVRWGHRILTSTDIGLNAGQMVVHSNGSLFSLLTGAT